MNRTGGWWQGNQANVEAHRTIHVELSKGSLSYSASIEKLQFLAPEIALAHVQWTMRGLSAKRNTDSGEFNGILSMVMGKRNGAWLIRAVQNTVTDPHPESAR